MRHNHLTPARARPDSARCLQTVASPRRQAARPTLRRSRHSLAHGRHRIARRVGTTGGRAARESISRRASSRRESRRAISHHLRGRMRTSRALRSGGRGGRAALSRRERQSRPYVSPHCLICAPAPASRMHARTGTRPLPWACARGMLDTRGVLALDTAACGGCGMCMMGMHASMA